MTIEMGNITDNATVVASSDLLCCELADGAVILDLNSGVYYGLDAVGTFIWGLIQEPKAVSAITSAVLEEYSVDHDRCLQDVQKLLSEMDRLNLIVIGNGQIN